MSRPFAWAEFSCAGACWRVEISEFCLPATVHGACLSKPKTLNGGREGKRIVAIFCRRWPRWLKWLALGATIYTHVGLSFFQKGAWNEFAMQL